MSRLGFLTLATFTFFCLRGFSSVSPVRSVAFAGDADREGDVVSGVEGVELDVDDWFEFEEEFAFESVTLADGLKS